MQKTTWYFERPPFSEIDAGGVLYHAHYLSLADRARHRWLENLGVTFERIWEQNLAPAVVRVESEYKRAVVQGKDVVVRTTLTGHTGVRFEFEQEFYVPENSWVRPAFKAGAIPEVKDPAPLGAPVFLLKIVVVCMNLQKKKAARWPAEITDLLG